MLNIPFNFAIPRSFHLRAPFRFKSTAIKAKLFGKNSLVLDNQTSYSACPKDKWIRKCFSDSVNYVMSFIVGFGEIP